MPQAPHIASVCRALPTPDDPAGGIFVLRRVEAMARRTRVSVLQPIPYFPALRPLPSWARNETHKAGEVEVQHAPMLYVPKVLKSLDGYWLYRAVLQKLAHLKRAGGLGIVDSHFGYPDGVGCVRAARQLGLPVFITIRGVETDNLRVPGVRDQVRRALSLAEGCIAVSHSLKRLAIDTGVPPDNIAVIHNAIDRDVFRPMDRLSARRRLGLLPDAPIIVSVGNLLSVKGHHTLVAAFAQLCHRKPGAHLVIVGGKMHEPAYPEHLKARIRALGVESAVMLAGKLEPSLVADWLAASDVFALASEREGCCNAILEALACGVPVVATPAGDNDWFVKDNLNGYLVPIGDSGAMAHALSSALDRQDWDRNRISSSLQVGDWEAVALQILEFMQERTGLKGKRLAA